MIKNKHRSNWIGLTVILLALVFSIFLICIMGSLLEGGDVYLFGLSVSVLISALCAMFIFSGLFFNEMIGGLLFHRTHMYPFQGLTYYPWVGLVFSFHCFRDAFSFG